jgi:hypothetical protein
MNSNFNSPDFNSYYSDPNSDSESAIVLSAFFKSHQMVSHGKNHHLLPCDETYQSPLHPEAHPFPVERFTEVFLYTVQADLRSRRNLILVCRHWYDIMLLTPGIHPQLRIYSWTIKEDSREISKEVAP